MTTEAKRARLESILNESERDNYRRVATLSIKDFRWLISELESAWEREGGWYELWRDTLKDGTLEFPHDQH